MFRLLRLFSKDRRETRQTPYTAAKKRGWVKVDSL